MVARSCNLRIWELEAGGSGIQGQSWLPSKFMASLDYMRLCLINNKQKNKKKKRFPTNDLWIPGEE